MTADYALPLFQGTAMIRLVLGVVQMNTRTVENACRLIDEAVEQGANFVGLPEYFCHATQDPRGRPEPLTGPTIQVLQGQAKRRRIWLHGGSIWELAADGRRYNTTVVLDPDGRIVARYRKVHPADPGPGVVDASGPPVAGESASIDPGDTGVVFETPWGRMGLTICYDLRFVELARAEALAGARIIWAPAAFSVYTGKDHWEVLNRARAIENQLFVACPALIGSDAGGIGLYTGGTSHFFGAAMIIDPWGTVIARAPERECAVVAAIDFAYQDEIRQRSPVLEARRPEAYRATEGGLEG